MLLAGLEREDLPLLIVPATDLSSAESSNLSLLPSGEPSSDKASEEDSNLPEKKPRNRKNWIPDSFKPRDTTRSKGTKFREYHANFLDTVVRLFGDNDILEGLTLKSYIYIAKVLSALSKGETLDP